LSRPLASGCRSAAVAIALLSIAALAAAGCGLGAGKGLGDVTLTVTRDFGARQVVATRSDGVSEADTVMRVLERDAKIETRYGGGFVQAIEGLEAQEGGGGYFDWFFYVDGVESTVGAADYSLHGGEAIWWDYRDWSAAMRVPAVVGSWPQPFLDGYDGRRRPVAVECMGGGAACGTVEARLRSAGADVSAGVPGGAIRVLVGPWSRVRVDPAAAQIEAGPQRSGVFAELTDEGGHSRLVGLDSHGERARAFGPSAGLLAATRRYEDPPVWVVTGAGERGVAAAAGLLDSADLRNRYAVATEGGRETALPVR
jgi:hypothetical protein